MRVLILGLDYLPESASIGPYTAALAAYLRQQGHDARVVTSFPKMPQWRIWEGYRGEWFRRETINAVPVRRTYIYVPREPRRAFNRILHDISFSASALIGALAGGPCEVVLAISPPLQLGLTGWLIASLMRAPLFFHIQDLVPDAAIATGLLASKSLAIRVGRVLERFVYRRAAGIGVICSGFQSNLERKGVSPEKIRLLPNSIDLDFMRVHGRNNAFRRAHGLALDDFVLMYSGSIALKQGLEVMIEAAALLADVPRVKFVILGDGPQLDDLKARARSLELRNVRFMPFQPRERLPEQLGAADALMITQKKAVTDIVFPGKLLYYMAAARPIVAAVSLDSETGRFIESQQVGVVVPPEDPAALAHTIRTLLARDVTAIGRRGREVVEAMFDERVVLPAFAAALERVYRPDARLATSESQS